MISSAPRFSESVSGILHASRTDGPGRMAALASYLKEHHATIEAAEGDLNEHNGTTDFDVRIRFRCSQDQMKKIEDKYREDLWGFSVHLDKRNTPMMKRPHVIRMLSYDAVGIDAELTSFLAQHGLNISTHRSTASDFPNQTQQMYVVEIWIDLPSFYDKNELQSTLNDLKEIHHWLELSLLTMDEHMMHPDQVDKNREMNIPCQSK